jgi:hypothetical protein
MTHWLLHKVPWCPYGISTNQELWALSLMSHHLELRQSEEMLF